MTVLVDTRVLYADHNTEAARHDGASDALDAVYDGELGLPYVSDYIYNEAVTLTLTRSDSFGAAKWLGERLRGDDSYPQTYEMLRVSAAVFADAVDDNVEYSSLATPASSAATSLSASSLTATTSPF